MLWAIKNALGGEIVVPKIPSYRITDVAKAIAPNAKLSEVGIRPGEKISEEMITENDGRNTVDIGSYFLILPSSDPSLSDHYLTAGARRVPDGFSYNSASNSDFLSIKDIRQLIVRHVEAGFTAEGY